MRHIVLAVACLAPVAVQSQAPARNVILFLADAAGISTLSAASLHGYGAPRRLFVQRMPYIGLAETSTASDWVTDSAAGMTAIVSGVKTHNGVVGQSAEAVRGKKDGLPLKTILEYAEERGLSTGLVTNDSPAGATPAALYAKSNERDATARIFLQLFQPHFGDGVDVMIAAGRKGIAAALTTTGSSLDEVGRRYKRPIAASLAELPAGGSRALALLERDDFDLTEATRAAMRMLSRNPAGYFLMVESDAHTDLIRHGLNRMVAFDRTIDLIAEEAGRDTLVLFTADHSFDLRVYGGRRGEALLKGLPAGEEPDAEAITLRAVRMNDDHTGEEVLVAAQGPGAERVRGVIANTELFRIMLAAYGWPETAGTGR
jgi:alkaline phosphatase